jgi:hypothetical protein
MSIGRVYRAIGVAFFEVEIQLLQSEILPNVELGRAGVFARDLLNFRRGEACASPAAITRPTQ